MGIRFKKTADLEQIGEKYVPHKAVTSANKLAYQDLLFYVF